MTAAKHLLVVSHVPAASANMRKLTDAAARGAMHEDIGDVEVRVCQPPEAGVDEVLWSDAVIIGTMANNGYMSGLTKDFFDRIYYPCLEKTQGKPYALFIRAGLGDESGALAGVERIVTGLRWQQVQAPLVARGEFRDEYTARCEELGMTLAAGLEAGVY